MIYRIEINHPNISVKYISETKIFPESESGWFFISNGKLKKPLPKMDDILDSLKIVSPKYYFITERNGTIPFYINGKVVRSLNYGDFITKYKTVNFDSLNYGLYKRETDSLRIISSNGNDLHKQQDGIYFIPQPGFGVIRKFNKKDIFDMVNSVSKLSSPPSELSFEIIE